MCVYTYLKDYAHSLQIFNVEARGLCGKLVLIEEFSSHVPRIGGAFALDDSINFDVCKKFTFATVPVVFLTAT